jgi:succinyl-diaminopimelate desuccinylase
MIVPDECLEEKGISPDYPRINIFANLDLGKKNTIHLNGHYDVVPADAKKWSTPPFEPVFKDGLIFGRGSSDMKGSLVSLIFALKALKEMHLTPCVNIQISITCDEETGGELGMEYFCNTDNLRGNFGIGEGPSGNYISIGNKGILWAEVEISGEEAHSAYSLSKGKNAFERMAEIIPDFVELKNEIVKRKTKYNTVSEEDAHPTMVLGGVSSTGIKTNIVPGKATFTIDRRIIPEEGLLKAKEEILNLAKKLENDKPEFKIDVRFIYENEPVSINEDELIVQNFKKALEKVLNKEAELVLTSGGTDARYLVKKGIPSIGYSPKGANYHSPNEYVELESIIETSAIYATLFTEFINE